jgi:hypothetical protein
MTPELAKGIRDEFGNHWLANVGGWLHTGESIEERIVEFRKALDA